MADKFGVTWRYVPGRGAGRSWIGTTSDGREIDGMALHLEAIPTELVNELHRLKTLRGVSLAELGREMVEAYIQVCKPYADKIPEE
jgi:hypothetical protein